MKRIIKLSLAAAALAALLFSVTAQAQPFGPTSGTFGSVTVTNTAAPAFNTTTVASNAVPLYRGRGIAIWPYGAAAGNGTGATNFTLSFRYYTPRTASFPVTNATDTTFTLTFATPTATPSTAFLLCTNLPPLGVTGVPSYDNVPYLSLYQATWQTTNILYLTNVYYTIFQ